MKIWVDADAVPGEIKDIILRAARRLQIETILVANKGLSVPPGPFVSVVRVTKGADVADAYIYERGAPEDLCVTADIPLAHALVGRGLTVIDPRGEVYSEANIGERLAVRDLMTGLREAGVQTGGPPPFSPKAKQRFAALLDSLLAKALRQRGPGSA